MYTHRRTPAHTPDSIKRASGILIKMGHQLRRQPGPALPGCLWVSFAASLLILVSALMQLAVELDIAS